MVSELITLVGVGAVNPALAAREAVTVTSPRSVGWTVAGSAGLGAGLWPGPSAGSAGAAWEPVCVATGASAAWAVEAAIASRLAAASARRMRVFRLDTICPPLVSA